MAKELWNQRKRDSAQKILDFLIEQNVLLKAWNWADEKTYFALRELAASSEPSQSESTVMATIRELIQSGKSTVGDYEAIFMKMQDNALDADSKAFVEWNFYIPLDIQLQKDLIEPVSLKILGQNIEIIDPESFLSRLPENERGKFSGLDTISKFIGKDINIGHMPYSYLVASIRGKKSNYVSAWRRLESSFDTFRGMVEFMHSCGNIPVCFEEFRMGPRSVLPHPLWMIAQPENEPLQDIYFVTSKYQKSFPYKMGLKEFSQLRNQFIYLQETQQPSSSISLISECLGLYVQAMDASSDSDCFLGLWQLAEAISLSKSIRGNTDQIVSRLVWHGRRIGLAETGYENIMQLFGQKRNELVHQSRKLADNDDANTLKIICEVALDWLISVREKITTRSHLDHYYKLQTAAQSELDAMREVIDFINMQRCESM